MAEGGDGMVVLRIDGERCDIGKFSTLPLDFEASSLTKVEGARDGRTIELTIPSTPTNNRLLGSACDIYSTRRFNTEHHTATLEKEGVELFKGTAYLLSTTINGENDSYTIRICEGGAEWIESVVKRELSTLDIPFSASLDLKSIAESWEGSCAVRFLPVCRHNEAPRYSSVSTLPVERVMLSDDYHPFISVAKMVEAMFADLGYTLRSKFLESELGQSLYMSGDYARSDSSKAKAQCNFFARRSKPVSATANYLGRVYASNSFATNTVGPIVDTADPTAIDSNGVPMYETFSTNGSFSKSDYGDICFTPKYSVKAGFILHLEYTTEYKIRSREEFVGFDMIEAVTGVKVEFSLANTCKDYRNDAEANMQYRALVFNHSNGRKYRLVATLPSGETSIIGEWSSRSTLLVTPAMKPSLLTLQYYNTAGGVWQQFCEDWALYPGYIEEEGEIDVEMDLRLPPVDVVAGEQYKLDKFWFGGAEMGMKLTVGTGTTLRPYFTNVPGYGSTLTFKDVAPRQISQGDLLAALGNMFNLAFYTDEATKELFIEPLEELYKGTNEIELNDKIVAKELTIFDAGLDTPQTLRLSYLDKDRATQKFNNENDTKLGVWSHRNPLYGTKHSTKELCNPIFTTTLNASNVVSCAPSASLMQVGDVGVEEQGIDTSFTPRIVCYKGMRPLPNGECWIAGNKLDEYPYAAFLDDESINLCFENRNGLEGLHTYHLAQAERAAKRERITLTLHLTAAEAANLFTENGPLPSLRSIYRFDILGESSCYRLVKAERWSVEDGCIKCTFERELTD